MLATSMPFNPPRSRRSSIILATALGIPQFTAKLALEPFTKEALGIHGKRSRGGIFRFYFISIASSRIGTSAGQNLEEAAWTLRSDIALKAARWSVRHLFHPHPTSPPPRNHRWRRTHPGLLLLRADPADLLDLERRP